MKYIDADRLLVEIDKLCDEAPSYDDSRTYLMEVSSLIESLQQDESQVDKMLCSQIWWQEQGWTMIPPETTIEGIDSLLKAVRRKLQQEQQEADLDAEIDRFTKSLYHETFDTPQGALDEFDWDDISQVIEDSARHFAEWGAEHLKK